MKILIIGNGAREYSIGLCLLNDTRISQLYFAPGNGASSELGENVNIKTHDEIVHFCIDNGIYLVIIGPEAPLVGGLSDALRANHIRVFAPSKKAAQLEGSKIFMKNLLQTYNIPTARFMQGCDKKALCDFIDSLDSKIVLKADGLCGGKGVIITANKNEAKEILAQMLDGKLFGEAGSSVVVEEFLDGFELSVFAICDGKNFIVLPAAQDHKRLKDNDIGPNTGGMGAYAPSALCSDYLMEQIKTSIIKPTLDAMKEEGAEFCGVLFCGIMVVNNKPFVLEFNVRFGDPECEVILPLLKTPLLDILNAAVDGKLEHFKCELIAKFCVGVVAASADYPSTNMNPSRIINQKINFLSNQISHISFAGVKKVESSDKLDLGLIADGGRIFVAVGIGDSLLEAKNAAYKLLENISFSGIQYRSDIANRALH